MSKCYICDKYYEDELMATIVIDGNLVKFCRPCFNKEINKEDNQEQFSTGSVRDVSKGKLRYDLIPPFLLEEFAQHYTTGAEKYSDRNWEKGQPLTRIYASLMRHIQAWANGKTDENHLMAVAWNAFAIRFTEIGIKNGTLPKELDDRPEYMKPKLNIETVFKEKKTVTNKCDKCIHQPKNEDDDCGFNCDDKNDCFIEKRCKYCKFIKHDNLGYRERCKYYNTCKNYDKFVLNNKISIDNNK